MPSFSPFNKDIHSLTIEDLSALREVAEGWYIEYKQEVPKADSIAKSISAMANSYGGWIFYGVKENSKEESFAGEFVGTDRADEDKNLQRIRQAVASCMSPACHYDAVALRGPCSDLGIPEDKSIICIAVPQSIEAPHIHHRGLIYRRVGDGSEPKPETDRMMIEKLFDRSKARIQKLESWINQDPEFSESESDRPFLSIMIVPNLWKMPRKDPDITVASVKKALNSKENRSTVIPFDTFYKSAATIIARQCGPHDPASAMLTWKIQPDLSGEILYPLPIISGSPQTIALALNNKAHKETFIRLLEKSGTQSHKVIDLSIVYNLLNGLVESQREMQTQADWPLDFNIKIRVMNAWRYIPYLDTKFFMHQLESNGIPINLTDECISPPGHHPLSFWNVPDESSSDNVRVRAGSQTIIAFCPIADAFGVQLAEILETHEQWITVLREITDASLRAAAAYH